MNEDILFDNHIENEYDQVLTQEDIILLHSSTNSAILLSLKS